MKKTLGLVLAMVFVVGTASFAQDATIDIYKGWNMIGISRVPKDPTPATVFAGYGSINNLMKRWDATKQGYVFYNTLNKGAFGNCLLGDAYWLNASTMSVTSKTISYTAIPNGMPGTDGKKTDMWLSLPGNQTDVDGTGAALNAGGWHLVTCPFAEDISFSVGATTNGDNIKVTDGITVKTWKDASSTTVNWVNRNWKYWDATAGGYKTAAHTLANDKFIRGGRGYWVQTMKDNLAVIIPANP